MAGGVKKRGCAPGKHKVAAVKKKADEQKLAVAVACYAVARKVHNCKLSRGSMDVAALLRLYITDGMRGSRARVMIRSAKYR